MLTSAFGSCSASKPMAFGKDSQSPVHRGPRGQLWATHACQAILAACLAPRGFLFTLGSLCPLVSEDCPAGGTLDSFSALLPSKST